MSQVDDDLLARLQVSFLEELEDRTRAMAALLAKPHDDPHREEDLLDLYRSAHNIKGAARAVGQDDVQAAELLWWNDFGVIGEKGGRGQENGRAPFFDEGTDALGVERIHLVNAADAVDHGEPQGEGKPE